MAYPHFVCSHTVRGTCTIGFTRAVDGAAATITVPEGVYWNDPVYSDTKTLAYSLQGKVCSLLDAADGGLADWTASPSAQFADTQWFEAGYGTGWSITPATCNAEGRRVLQRLGLSPTTATVAVADEFIGGLAHGLWCSLNRDGTAGRKERDTESFLGRHRTRGGVLVGFSGAAWPATIGYAETRRAVALNTITRELVKNETSRVNFGQESLDTDFTLETTFWNWASKGELVRVYSDVSATRTYVTAAVTDTATTISVASGTGLANAETIWVDGEIMRIVSGGGTGTLTVERPVPVSHPAGAPVSDAHVGTYSLDTDGGNVTLLDFAPARRSPSSPFYDVSIALVRANWDG
jgi:hypothetical protein